MRSGVCQGVFTALVEGLGVKNVQFEEILDLSPDYLRAIAFVLLTMKFTRLELCVDSG